ncbi:efflux RND transporter periplasmic adaptor subunit [Desulfomonile tiedjei]|uniref:CzcB-like barrel-sandwich hybrid domain-containing protein n=1 Tax=Desulfomonile tiedjei (strain ATCC 49306 / DSM 6799 / DCB-1) TaxID=706587 RepID=I4C2K1_DESTA|nr:efflux RND transporter periplasmic adaptor subunit [Desulfomonile tiedjei]AFM23792.1 hypothetical protein Desti_1078 [Desulfomonile tiedjei DSM 6799]
MDTTEAPHDGLRKALAIGLELAKNAARAQTLDEFQFILVNDTRALLPFDRSMLILHMNGKSVLAAANNQPRLETRAGLVQKINELAPKLRDIRTGLVLFSNGAVADDIPPETAEELREYIASTGCQSLMLIPFVLYDKVLGHLILEFFEKVPPGQIETYTFMNMVPFFSSALAEKWLLAHDSRVRKSFFEAMSPENAVRDRKKSRIRLITAGVGLFLLLVVLWYPTTLVIGGKTEVVPDHEFVSFVEIEGVISKIMTKEGESVKKNQILAELESQEIDYKIREAKRAIKALETEAEILRGMGAENPLKLAESKLVQIKSIRARQQLEFLDWQRQFLNIKSPIDGIVLTKKVETLVGKRFKAGEPFCRIAPHENLATDVFVRESDIGYIEPNQRGSVYFNYRPDQPYAIKVQNIAPKSETVERIGAVFRVRAELMDRPPDVKPGMLGIAHIDTKNESLWFILTRRIKTKLNEIMLFL